jgi:hypothetical protein
MERGSRSPAARTAGARRIIASRGFMRRWRGSGGGVGGGACVQRNAPGVCYTGRVLVTPFMLVISLAGLCLSQTELGSVCGFGFGSCRGLQRLCLVPFCGRGTEGKVPLRCGVPSRLFPPSLLRFFAVNPAWAFGRNLIRARRCPQNPPSTE